MLFHCLKLLHFTRLCESHFILARETLEGNLNDKDGPFSWLCFMCTPFRRHGFTQFNTAEK